MGARPQRPSGQARSSESSFARGRAYLVRAGDVTAFRQPPRPPLVHSQAPGLASYLRIEGGWKGRAEPMCLPATSGWPRRWKRGVGADLMPQLRTRRIIGVAAAPTAVREPRCSVTGCPRISLVTGSLGDLANWTVDVVIQTREDAGRVSVCRPLCLIRVGTRSWRALYLTGERSTCAGSHEYCRRDSDRK